jgi:hypothetical protein
MANQSQYPDKSWTANLPLMVLLFVIVCGIYLFLMFYGFIHTPDNPLKMMG